MLTININSRLPIGNMLFSLVGLPPIPLTFEAWEAGLFALLHAAEEALIGKI